MNRGTKIWIVVAFSLILTGCMLGGGVMMALNWDFLELSVGGYETNRSLPEGTYGSISISVDTADLSLVPSENGKTEVVCYEQKKVRHSVAVQEGVLVIQTEDTRKWYEQIGLNFGTPKITLAIPRGEYEGLKIRTSTGDVSVPQDFRFERIDITGSTGSVKNGASASQELKLKTSTGDIFLENCTAGSLNLSVSTGDVTASKVTCAGDVRIGVSTGKTKLNGLRCKTLNSHGDTGDLMMKDVVASEAFSIERSTGHVDLEACDAAAISITTDTGDVKGSLRSEKIFFAESDTGDVDVPKTMTGGRCEISTDTGDIKLRVLT